MTITTDVSVPAPLDFRLPPELEAREPPEPRDGVRLLVAERSSGRIQHRRFDALPSLLTPGDVLVVNTSATLPAALDAGRLVVHLSTRLDDGRWVIELREPSGSATVPYVGGAPGDLLQAPGEAAITLLSRWSASRLWVAQVDVPGQDVIAHLGRFGRPVRYGYVRREWPLAAYQTVFAAEPGSAEMPSAGRPFTPDLVARLVARGVLVVPITLHTGLASPEADEKPYPEHRTVPAVAARTVEMVRAVGGRVIAVGTTVVRALESAADKRGAVRPVSGWTDLVVTPETGVRVVDGLLTGLHEPRASHLRLLEAVSGRALLERSYAAALAEGYRWHEFGDSHLVLP